MHEQVVETTKALLQSIAFQTELDRYMQQFNAGFTMQVQGANGQTYTKTVLQPITLKPFAQVWVGEPPQDVPGPYPCAYVYHIVSEYPKEDQEDDIVNGRHRCSVTIIDAGATPEIAERTIGRLGTCVKRCIERNQYIYGQIPGAFGMSSVTFVESEVTGQHLSSVRVPYHILFVAQVREVRY